MVSRKKVDDVLVAVDAANVSQREWDFLTTLRLSDVNEITIAQALLERRKAFEDTRQTIDSLTLLANCRL
ncbi:hypothetical protein [Photobacterium indicum]|uniref:hypothetical protein n=1 Tax=Photobacterium indicum TaxID=81447 RepID=UPI003D096932